MSLKNTSVRWYINDIEGGNELVGSIDENENYTLPSNFKYNFVDINPNAA